MRTRIRKTPWLLVACGILLSGCAKFDDRAAGQTFGPEPALSAPAGPRPELPEIDGSSGNGPAGPAAPRTSVPPPQGCTDFDKAVIATCLDTISALATLPGDAGFPAGLAAERRSGRVLQVGGGKATELAKLTVDAGGDGGLTGLALSPTYPEDQLVFAYITTAADNRVVRFTKGQQAKPILTGIPKGPGGNRGAILSDGHALLVATGDAGDPAAAADPNSLAGKVLRIDTSGNPAVGNPTPGSRVYASGLHSPGGLCKSTADPSRLWVTDRAPDRDVLYRVRAAQSLSVPAWTWPDKPGVAGCVDEDQLLAIATSVAGNVQILPVGPDGSIGGTPKVTLDGKNGTSFGRLQGMDPIDAQHALVGTVNRDGGTPVSSDDRVLVIQIQPNAAGGSGKD
ncbi:MAG TPA: PQQ-dependent sugar dehydrogenase [Amycolatopsis sp.]|uniref:PQQ-dependent sugar dehydrogenase n=1 Tax=Amycolatopsis sp. TaxID=37632 RepID=UPI002B4874DB|nr:PQQ-dependent sugar dehydrogenase [Amycolatopsis sp.]HKS48235.1 PQQ-dependent sugar dehydrogenase [Amycolatopsis sp.]